MPKIPLPAGRPVGRITCPHCGNDDEFVEVAENVVITTRYTQNDDGSFTPKVDDSVVHGAINLFCGACGRDLSRFHNHLMGMLF